MKKPLFKWDKKVITVSHKDKEINFSCPLVPPLTSEEGYITYNKAGKALDDLGALRPTFSEINSLIYAAVRNINDKKYSELCNFLLSTLVDQGLWAFNKIGYVKDEGVYVGDREGNKKVLLDVRSGNKGKYMRELFDNPFVLALTEGREGAEKLVETSKILKMPIIVINANYDFKVRNNYDLALAFGKPNSFTDSLAIMMHNPNHSVLHAALAIEE